MKKSLIQLTNEQIKELNSFKNDSSSSSKETLRVLAILLIEKKVDHTLIKDLTEYDRKYGLNLRRKYLKGGLKAISDREGKKPRALLTKGQREHIATVLKTSTPEHFGYKTKCWTTAILGSLIREQYNVQYSSKTAITLLFKEARFTYHKPDKQYKKRDQKAIDSWIEKYTPIVKQALSEEKTVVLTADEMMLSTQTTTQKIWLPKGEFPKIDVGTERKIRTIYGALDVKTGHQHALKTNRANSQSSCAFLDFLGGLHSGYKIVLLWDNASWHKSEEVKEYLRTTKHNFHLINFPPYAPELNPQEHVWKAGRSKVTHNACIEDIDKGADNFVDYLNSAIFSYSFTCA
jgi:transposase